MTNPALELNNGDLLPYTVKYSPRSETFRLKLTAREGLVVFAPIGLDPERIAAIVGQKRDWIEGHLLRFEEVKHLLVSQPIGVRPQAFDLPALGESWLIEYHATQAKTVGARIDRPGRLIVAGQIEDIPACHKALCRWLARRAREMLEPWAERLAAELQLEYSQVLIKGQRTRWGSCSAQGVISLNYKLLFLPHEWVRYVLIHELCHTIEMNHTARFWALLRGLEPNTDKVHPAMRDAWKLIPPWIGQGRLPKGDL